MFVNTISHVKQRQRGPDTNQNAAHLMVADGRRRDRGALLLLPLLGLKLVNPGARIEKACLAARGPKIRVADAPIQGSGCCLLILASV